MRNTYIHLYVKKYDKYEHFLLLDFISENEYAEFLEYNSIAGSFEVGVVSL